VYRIQPWSETFKVIAADICAADSSTIRAFQMYRMLRAIVGRTFSWQIDFITCRSSCESQNEGCRELFQACYCSSEASKKSSHGDLELRPGLIHPHQHTHRNLA
jgi:hypothetical protein